MSGRLDCHTERSALHLGILDLPDAITQQHFAVGVDHLVDHCRFLDQTPALVPSFIIKVQLRTVAIPQGIAKSRHHRLLLAVELLTCSQFSIDCRRTIQVGCDGIHRLKCFPSFLFGPTIVLLEYLAKRIDRYATTTQCDQQTPSFRGNFGFVRIAEFFRYETCKTFTLIGSQFILQTRGILRKRVVKVIAHLFGRGEDILPNNPGRVFKTVPADPLFLNLFHQNIENRRVQRILLDLFGRKPLSVRQSEGTFFQARKESAGRSIDRNHRFVVA